MGDSSLPVLPVTENYWLQEITGYRDLVSDRVAQGHFGYRKFLDQSVVLIWQFPKHSYQATLPYLTSYQPVIGSGLDWKNRSFQHQEER